MISIWVSLIKLDLQAASAKTIAAAADAAAPYIKQLNAGLGDLAVSGS